MLAQNFKTAQDLDIPESWHAALITVLGMMEREEIKYGKGRHRRNQPHDLKIPPEKFNMGYFAGDGFECGTVGCIAGWAAFVGDLNLIEMIERTVNKSDSFQELCMARGRKGFIDEITVEQAARAIRNYLTEGHANWREVLT